MVALNPYAEDQYIILYKGKDKPSWTQYSASLPASYSNTIVTELSDRGCFDFGD
jgi:hypothetical protein